MCYISLYLSSYYMYGGYNNYLQSEIVVELLQPNMHNNH